MENNYKKVGHMLSKEGKVEPDTRGMAPRLKEMLGETDGSIMKMGMITDETPLQGDSSGDGPSYDTENPMMKKGKGKKDPRYKDMTQAEIDAKVKTHYTGEGDEKETRNDAIKRFKEENPEAPENKPKLFPFGKNKIKAKF